jgi:hypothetical protein
MAIVKRPRVKTTGILVFSTTRQNSNTVTITTNPKYSKHKSKKKIGK